MNGTGSRKTSGARLWFVIHGWLALPIWSFLFFVCLTGSIATVSQKILWLARPMVRQEPGARHTFKNPAVDGKLMTARFSAENVLGANDYQGGTGPNHLALGALRTFRLSLTTDF